MEIKKIIYHWLLKKGYMNEAGLFFHKAFYINKSCNCIKLYNSDSDWTLQQLLINNFGLSLVNSFSGNYGTMYFKRGVER